MRARIAADGPTRPRSRSRPNTMCPRTALMRLERLSPRSSGACGRGHDRLIGCCARRGRSLPQIATGRRHVGNMAMAVNQAALFGAILTEPARRCSGGHAVAFLLLLGTSYMFSAMDRQVFPAACGHKFGVSSQSGPGRARQHDLHRERGAVRRAQRLVQGQVRASPRRSPSRLGTRSAGPTASFRHVARKKRSHRA
jgi:hypothetical protein